MVAPPLLRTLIPAACDGRGPSATCVNILHGMIEEGAQCSLYVGRHRTDIDGIPFRSAIPGPLSFLPYRYVGKWASRLSEREFLKDLKEGDIAYLWPAASLETHRAVHRRGNPIVLEGINTRRKFARRILDPAYQKMGLEPQHRITDQAIEEEEEKLSLATSLFAPNRHVELALADTPLADGGLIRTSYGASLRYHRMDARREPRDSLNFLFVGTACVRKGTHLLLEAWDRASINGALTIAGDIEPVLARYCAKQLRRPDVVVSGWVKDVRPFYRQADVFVMPSLEEGGPQVTYEAAAYRLPIIASPMGASRMADGAECLIEVDPEDVDAMSAALTRLAESADERASWGARAHDAVQAFDWPLVGRERARKLFARFGADVREVA